MNITTDRNSIADIQKGAVTHHHDQFIIPINFSATNSTPNNPTIPIPELELELEFFIIFHLISFNQSLYSKHLIESIDYQK